MSETGKVPSAASLATPVGFPLRLARSRSLFLAESQSGSVTAVAGPRLMTVSEMERTHSCFWTSNATVVKAYFRHRKLSTAQKEKKKKKTRTTAHDSAGAEGEGEGDSDASFDVERISSDIDSQDPTIHYVSSVFHKDADFQLSWSRGKFADLARADRINRKGVRVEEGETEGGEGCSSSSSSNRHGKKCMTLSSLRAQNPRKSMPSLVHIRKQIVPLARRNSLLQSEIAAMKRQGVSAVDLVEYESRVKKNSHTIGGEGGKAPTSPGGGTDQICNLIRITMEDGFAPQWIPTASGQNSSTDLGAGGGDQKGLTSQTQSAPVLRKRRLAGVRLERAKMLPTHNHTINVEMLYELEEDYGEGTFGKVHKGKERTSGVVRAVKIVPFRSPWDARKFRSEVAALARLDHPNIVRSFESFDSDHGQHALVMEPLVGGELFDLIKVAAPFPERLAAAVIRQILAALAFSHAKGIAHRDIKPENILLEENAVLDDQNRLLEAPVVKLIDFGLSTRFVPGRVMKDTVGTPYYMCKEVIEGKYDETCDVWSSGLILFLMLTGKQPYLPEDTEEQTKDTVLNWRYDPSALEGEPAWSALSEDAKDLLAQMLRNDRAERWSAALALRHDFLSPSREEGGHATNVALTEKSRGVSDSGAATSTVRGQFPRMSALSQQVTAAAAAARAGAGVAADSSNGGTGRGGGAPPTHPGVESTATCASSNSSSSNANEGEDVGVNGGKQAGVGANRRASVLSCSDQDAEGEGYDTVSVSEEAVEALKLVVSAAEFYANLPLIHRLMLFGIACQLPLRLALPASPACWLCRRVFSMLDLRGDGVLSWDELAGVARFGRKSGAADLPEEELMYRLLQSLDSGSSGFIEQTEVAAALLTQLLGVANCPDRGGTSAASLHFFCPDDSVFDSLTAQVRALQSLSAAWAFIPPPYPSPTSGGGGGAGAGDESAEAQPPLSLPLQEDKRVSSVTLPQYFGDDISRWLALGFRCLDDEFEDGVGDKKVRQVLGLESEYYCGSAEGGGEGGGDGVVSVQAGVTELMSEVHRDGRGKIPWKSFLKAACGLTNKDE